MALVFIRAYNARPHILLLFLPLLDCLHALRLVDAVEGTSDLCEGDSQAAGRVLTHRVRQITRGSLGTTVNAITAAHSLQQQQNSLKFRPSSSFILVLWHA